MLVPKVTRVSILPEYTLKIEFADGAQRTFDVKPYISGGWFGELKNEAYFRQVRIADDGIEWPHGQDIAPHELYGV